jgi:hypothetical protein
MQSDVEERVSGCKKTGTYLLTRGSSTTLIKDTPMFNWWWKE